jgi:plastocyanin
VSRLGSIAAFVLIPLALLGAVWYGARLLDDDGGTARTAQVESDVTFDHDYRIDAGTQQRIDAGEEVEIVPAELVVHVGESIRIVNDDVVDHTVGAFYVAAGETLTQEFRSPGTLEGECTVHPSGQFVLRVLE